MNWKITSISLLAGLLAGAVVADDFTLANALYHDGKFADAAAAYEKVEPKTAAVYFNLGNAWFRQGKLGEAVLNYERARRLEPRDPDIMANLHFAEKRLGVEEVNQSAVAWRRFMHGALFSRTVGEWSGYELAGIWLTGLFVAGIFWLPRWRTGLVILAVATGLWWSVATAGLSYRVYLDRQAPAAVVTSEKVEARFAPLTNATVHFELHEGTKVFIREDRGAWLYMERADGQQGWVPAESVGRVAVP